MPPGHFGPDRGVGVRISLIVAVAENGVIGRDGDLPWRLPDDLRHFKAVTMGKPVLMGRRTWDSLKGPLPGRRNLVLSRNAALQRSGAEIVSSLEDALRVAADVDELVVIGGAQLYALALPVADRLYVTRVHASVSGDTHFPEIQWEDWHCVERRTHPADARHVHAFTMETWERGREKLADPLYLGL